MHACQLWILRLSSSGTVKLAANRLLRHLQTGRILKAMATPVLIPVSEYLNTTYRPDRDYVDGELNERNLGEKPHGLLQGILYSLFQNNRREWGLLPIPEQRVQTSATHFRIPDLCVIRPVAGELLVRSAPVLCIEVLSKDDTLENMRDRIEDYLQMGVEHIWVLDPLKHEAYQATAQGYEAVHGIMNVAGTPVRVDLNDVFQQLEDLLAGRL